MAGSTTNSGLSRPPPGLGFEDEKRKDKGWQPCAEAEEISTDKYWQLLARLRRAPNGAVPLKELQAKAPAGLYQLMGDATSFGAWLRHRTGLVEVTGLPGEEWLVLNAPERMAADHRALRRRQGEAKVIDPEKSMKGKVASMDAQAVEYNPGFFGGFNPSAMEFVPSFCGGDGSFEFHDWGNDSHSVNDDAANMAPEMAFGAMAGFFYPMPFFASGFVDAEVSKKPSKTTKNAKTFVIREPQSGKLVLPSAREKKEEANIEA